MHFVFAGEVAIKGAALRAICVQLMPATHGRLQIWLFCHIGQEPGAADQTHHECGLAPVDAVDV
jgi:hypothetical protein